jgi:uncharacterized protein YgbK (DUF1537 family)
MRSINKQTLLDDLPAEWSTDLLPEIQSKIMSSGRKIVVLDDDPTGTQTVHDVPVLTEWSVEALGKELITDLPALYLLTNSRSLPLSEAQLLNLEIGQNLIEAGRSVDRDFVVVSRSDSTLRGHFPGEVEALTRALGEAFDAWMIIPFFLEGGRYTINDIHYVLEGDLLVPAGDTPYAEDTVFGYRSSNLCDWVQEKTQGRINADQVASISINDLRIGGPRIVAEKLLTLKLMNVCVVNAASYRDLEVLTAGLLEAEAQDQRFLYRTAASFVRVRSGLPDRQLLTPEALSMPESGGGLIVVGSHVPKTSEQLTHLINLPSVKSIEVNVKALLSFQQQGAEIARVIEQVNCGLHSCEDVVLYTSRQLVTASTLELSDNLSIGQRVSESLISIIKDISEQPRYILAKGGVTSSDVATKGLNVKRALVLGQILPGVPVWQLGPESRYPNLPYIVFPGNVGSQTALVEIVKSFYEVK